MEEAPALQAPQKPIPAWLIALNPEAAEVVAALAALRTLPHRTIRHHHGFDDAEEEEATV